MGIPADRPGAFSSEPDKLGRERASASPPRRARPLCLGYRQTASTPPANAMATTQYPALMAKRFTGRRS